MFQQESWPIAPAIRHLGWRSSIDNDYCICKQHMSHLMDVLPDTEWPDEFTREEMLEQQSHLLIEECHLLQKELSRYRKNMARLIGMHAETNRERDNLRAQLRKTELQLSDCRRESSALGNRVAGLESCRDQLGAIHEARRRSSSPSNRNS